MKLEKDPAQESSYPRARHQNPILLRLREAVEEMNEAGKRTEESFRKWKEAVEAHMKMG